jgi:hypothetical protein
MMRDVIPNIAQQILQRHSTRFGMVAGPLKVFCFQFAQDCCYVLPDRRKQS